VIVAAGALAAGVALWPAFEELKGALVGGEQWAAREIHPAPRKTREAERRKANHHVKGAHNDG